jgi:hypothetical protein
VPAEVLASMTPWLADHDLTSGDTTPRASQTRAP